MTEPNALTPRRSDASAASNFAPPQEVNLEGLKTVLQQKDLPVVSKIRLSMQRFRAVAEAHKQQVNAALEVSKAKTQADATIGKGAIVLYEAKAMSQMRGVFVDRMRQFGMRVDMEQLAFMQEFGEQITAFMKQLDTAELREPFRERIAKSAEKAFDQLCDRLDRLTDSLVQQATNEKH